MEEVIEKDKSTVSYMSATGWSCWLGKKAQHYQKESCRVAVGLGRESWACRGQGLHPVQSAGQPLPFATAPNLVVSDESELKCCQECTCNVEFRWESNKKHTKTF